MTYPGQRYFEQPLPDANTDNSPPRKQPFHQVFGNRRHRTFQPNGPGRGRRDSRGRGWNNNPFHRSDNTFQYNSHRNPNRRPHDRDPRESGREYPINEPHQPPFSPGMRRPGFRPNHFDPNVRHRSSDLRGSRHEYPVNEHPGNEPHQPLLEPGMKRPAFKPIDFDGRRKKKRVAGGRIKKFVRVEEFQGDTYCEICERGFRNVSEKTVHDRSKEHRLNIGYLRTEQMEKEQEQANLLDIATTHQVSEDVRRTDILKGTMALLNSKTLPRDFKEWAERSLTAARQGATESNDPSLLQAVQREIISVHKINDENCSLRRVCWTRREAATGSRYRDSSLACSSLPVIKDPESLTKDMPGASKKEEPYSGQCKSALSSGKAPRKTHAEAADVQREDICVEVADEAPPLPPTIVDQPPSDENRDTDTTPARSIPLPTANLRPYNELELKWRLSKAAQAMLSCCQTEHKEVVLANYNDKFGNTMMRDEDPAREQADVSPRDSLMATYHEIHQKYVSNEYDYEDMMERMSRLAKRLRDDKERILQLRHVLQMQTSIALQAGEFRDCSQPCSAFVRTFPSPLSVQGTDVNMVGQWFVSILLKGRSAGGRGFPALLEVAQEMRNFPTGVIEVHSVQESILAFKYVLGHNWYGFFKRTIENCEKSPLSQVIEGFIPFMREKALVTLIKMRIKENKIEKKNVLPSIPLADLQECLAWNSPEDVEVSVGEVKEFVTSLRHPFEMGRNVKGAECIQWGGSCDEELTVSDDIDVREDMLSKWNKARVLEED